MTIKTFKMDDISNPGNWLSKLITILPVNPNTVTTEIRTGMGGLGMFSRLFKLVNPQTTSTGIKSSEFNMDGYGKFKLVYDPFLDSTQNESRLIHGYLPVSSYTVLGETFQYKLHETSADGIGEY